MTRKTSLCSAVLLFVLVLLLQVPQGRSEPYVRLGGTVKLYTSVFTEGGEGAGLFPHEAGDFALTRAELWLKLNGYASDNVSFRARADLVYTADKVYDDFSDVEAGSGFSSEVQEFDINFREASFKLMDIFVPGMDLIVGRQRVRWGTSDEYNVIVCGGTADYVKTHYMDGGVFDNVDLFFFDQAKALAYAATLTYDIPPCLDDLPGGGSGS